MLLNKLLQDACGLHTTMAAVSYEISNTWMSDAIRTLLEIEQTEQTQRAKVLFLLRNGVIRAAYMLLVLEASITMTTSSEYSIADIVFIPLHLSKEASKNIPGQVLCIVY